MVLASFYCRIVDRIKSREKKRKKKERLSSKEVLKETQVYNYPERNEMR